MAPPRAALLSRSPTTSSCRSATSASARRSTTSFRSRQTTTSPRSSRTNGEVTTDEAYMARALALAERGRPTTSPNPMVGAVVVDAEGGVVGRGSPVFAGGPHAEVLALAEAQERARGATLYCTLEPCSH